MPTPQVSYNASGYGPYPFWTAGGGVGVLDGPGAAIRSYWSDVRNAERLEHASCDLKGVGHEDGVPCVHLFVNGSYAYLFSADEAFCCVSSTPDSACHMTRPQRDFMDVFSYEGVLANYTAEDGRYAGPAKK